MATGKVDQFDYGARTFLEEHIFVPDLQNPGNPVDTGWLIGLHHIISPSTTQLSVSASLSQAMPPGLHGSFATPQT